METFLGIGSNIEPESNIRHALNLIRDRGFHVTALSTHYRTEALRHKENPPYINGVWKIRTPEKSMEELDRELKGIEADCGRVRSSDKWASRTLDLDIILMKDYISGDAISRNFVYIPLLELDQDLVVPGRGRLQSLVDTEIKSNMQPLLRFTEELRRIINE